MKTNKTDFRPENRDEQEATEKTEIRKRKFLCPRFWWTAALARSGFLAFHTIPDYLDTAPLPAPGTSAVWKYKAIYRLGDEQVGQWSDVVSIPVAG